MNTEESANNISRHRDELLRLACEERDVAQASPDLRELLSDDPKLRAELEETGELVRELQDALRPQPLPETLLRRIHARLDERTGTGARTALHRFRLIGLAAAAALALAAIGPLTPPHTPREAPMPLALSAADAADIVEAWAMYRWDGHLAYSIERVSSELAEVDQQMDRASGVCTGLPWGPEDDWDLPPDDNDAAVPAATPPICRDAAPTGRRILGTVVLRGAARSGPALGEGEPPGEPRLGRSLALPTDARYCLKLL